MNTIDSMTEKDAEHDMEVVREKAKVIAEAQAAPSGGVIIETSMDIKSSILSNEEKE